jgi:hypothetical protein
MCLNVCYKHFEIFDSLLLFKIISAPDKQLDFDLSSDLKTRKRRIEKTVRVFKSAPPSRDESASLSSLLPRIDFHDSSSRNRVRTTPDIGGPLNYVYQCRRVKVRFESSYKTCFLSISNCTRSGSACNII